MLKKIISCVCVLGTLSSTVVLSSACKNKSADNSYDIVAKFDKYEGVLTGTEKFSYYNSTENEISALDFNLYPNAYREDAVYSPVGEIYSALAYYDGKSYGDISIESVKGGEYSVCGEDMNVLKIVLEKPLYPCEKACVEINFSVKLAKVEHRTGIGKDVITFGNCFPTLAYYGTNGFYNEPYYSDGDPFVSECANYSVELTVPCEYVIAHTGEKTAESVESDKKTYKIKADNVRDFAFVCSDKYKKESCTTNSGVEIDYFYYSDEMPTANMVAVKDAMEFFENKFGKYPYKTYAVCQTGLYYGGMEYPELVMISDSIKGKNLLHTLVHETAHQWWYAVVGSDQINEAWQDEGLAEYSTALFLDGYQGSGVSKKELVENAQKEYHSYYNIYSRAFGIADTRMSRSLKEYLSDYEYNAISYDKGLMLFDTLHESIGDKKFFGGLKKYYSSCAYKIASVGDMVGCFEKSGVDVNGLFESFLTGKAIV